MKKPKLFIVRKYIMALSAAEAIRVERKHPVDDCWIDEEWKKENFQKEGGVGFVSAKRKPSV